MENTTNQDTQIRQLEPFGDDRFPIMGTGLPNSYVAYITEPTEDEPSRKLIYVNSNHTYYTKELADLIAGCGCNIAQAYMFGATPFPKVEIAQDSESGTSVPKNPAQLNTSLSLQNLSSAGVYLMVRHDNDSTDYLDRFTESIDLFGKNNGIYCWMGLDEPNTGEFNLIKAADSAVSADRRPLYNNLFPQGADDFSLFGRPATAGEDEVSPHPHLGLYRDYLNRYQMTCQPQIWSYDNYGVTYNQADDDPGVALVIKDNFFPNMMRMRSAAKMSGKPFWAYVYTYELTALNNMGRISVITAPSLRMQAFSSIALGAKGLAYWRIVTGLQQDLIKFNDFKDLPEIYETDSEERKKEKQDEIDAYYSANTKRWYPEAPIMTDAVKAVHTDGDDNTGTRITAPVGSNTDSDNDQSIAKVTVAKLSGSFGLVSCPSYRSITEINEQIHKFGHLFMRGNVTDFRCTNPGYKYSEKTAETSFKALPPLTKSFTAIKSINVDGMNSENGSALLLSRLETPSSGTYIIVVNLDINKKHKVSISFNQNMTDMNGSTDKRTLFEPELAAGGWAIYKMA